MAGAGKHLASAAPARHEGAVDFRLPPREPPPELAALLPAGLDPALATAAATAWATAPFLKGLMRSRSALLATLAADGPERALEAALHSIDHDEPALAVRLRRARGDVALLVALADLAGLWPLEKVTAALSDFADLALDRAVAAALSERGAPNRGLAVLALGKLGSRELNYSSDVDLILIHEPDLLPCRPGEEPDEAAVRIARRAVALIADPMADGYVARVDLRLRPASEITPMSLSAAAAEHYYQSSAETWERLAFVRARAAAGDPALGEEFLGRIRPFVWRQSLDYTAVRDIGALSLRIRDHWSAGQMPGPGYDLKRGRGGIREVEFFAQIHQLLWGGRDASLRPRATLDALAALAAAGRIEDGEAEQLGASYRALRTLEHRLQMRADAQTHEVPKLAAEREQVALLSGATGWAAVERALVAVITPVAASYDRLITAAAPDPTPMPADHGRWLKTHYPGLATILAPLIAGWRGGKVRALKSPPAMAAFERLLPALVAGIAAAAEPKRAAARLDSFFHQLPAAAQFLALLEANPRLVALLGTLLGVAPSLADALARTPALFDVMLGPEAFEPLPPAEALAAELARLVEGQPFETMLDRVRRWTGERRFQLGAQLVEGRASPLAVAASLADLADAALAVVVPAVTAAMVEAHGIVPGAEPVVLALGRYGGGSLTHASDLDLIYLHTQPTGSLSVGVKPISASLWLNRWAQRLTTALSVPTAHGELYEVDTRLRPWGAKGPLATSIESFARYHAGEAEGWEHMALQRARPVAGAAAAQAAAAAAVQTILRRPRDRAEVLAWARQMRADIATAKPGQGAFDVKLAPGGLVDLEFIVHALQLLTPSALDPDMASGIERLAAAGALSRAQADGLSASLRLLTGWLVLLRLVAPGPALAGGFSHAVEALIAKTFGQPDFAAACAELTLARNRVRLAWEELFRNHTGES